MITYYRSVLVHLFSLVNTITKDPFSHPNEYKLVQEILIDRISYIESRIRTLKRNAKESKTRLRSKDKRLSKTQARNEKKFIKVSQKKIKEYQGLLVTFRWIGDALVFSLFDSFDIKPFALARQKAGFISGKKGSRRERKIFRELFNYGYLAILTDLTNCLRYGDLLVFSREGDWHLAEVKTSKVSNRRVDRQIEKIDNILNFLRSDQSNFLYGEEEHFQRISARGDVTRYLSEINQTIRNAKSNISSYRKIEDGLFYIASYDISVDIIIEIVQSFKGKVLLNQLNPDIYEDFAYYPLPLSIDNPDALIEICQSKLKILVLVDCGVLESRFKNRGFNFKYLEDDKDNALLLTKPDPKTNELVEIRVGYHLFNRIFNEFLSIDWLIKLCEEIVHKAEEELFTG